MDKNKAIEILEWIRRDKKYASDPMVQSAVEYAEACIRESEKQTVGK